MSKKFVFVFAFAFGVGVFALLMTLLLQYVTYFFYDFLGYSINSYQVKSLMGLILAIVLCASVVVLLKITKTSGLFRSMAISTVVFVTFFLIETLMRVWPYFSSDSITYASMVFSPRLFGIGIWFLLLALLLGAIYSLISKAKLSIQCAAILILIISMSAIFNSYNEWVSSTNSSNTDYSKSLFLQHIKFLVS